MGTAKRERQKANRALRQIEQQQQARKTAKKRTALKWAVGIVAAFVAVVLIAWIGGAFDGGDDNNTLAEEPDPVEPVNEPEPTIPPLDSLPEPGECPSSDGTTTQKRQFDVAPQMCIDPAKTYTAEIVTSVGTLKVDLLADKAPLTVNNFVTLSRYHYYDGITCHRIIPGFMAQCGDPTGTGSGGPGYTFPDELPEEGEYQIGSVAMANAGPDTNGSQFFVITGERGVVLPPNYSLFGQVIEGLDDTVPALDAAGNPDPAANGVPPLTEVTIESITITES